MSREDLTLAILQPAALGNWKVQEGLVDVILGDLGDEPGALPLLSHALLETWKRRRGRVLTVSGYTASGGVQGAIAQTAETVFRQRLTPEQQPIARMIFMKLAEIGEGALDTRRRATFSELITKASDPVIIDAVLGILTDARLDHHRHAGAGRYARRGGGPRSTYPRMADTARLAQPKP